MYPIANTGMANTNAKAIAAAAKIGNEELGGAIENAYRNIIKNTRIEENNEILVIFDLPHLARPAFFSVLDILYTGESLFLLTIIIFSPFL